ncbi:MAG TPA: P-loop NTPase fold protein, partial [Saprospiraceae bacterium]|nr:P-loop NTPase fold protein [Saprospiraceae bacterium]
MEKLKFKILTEDVEVGDNINEAQQNIADGIVNIIKENEQASTIGLQGPWGSGKSTIIKQVHEKLDDPNKYIYFYFDAWAHEGDFLRKIFLRNLVEEISNKYEENAENLSQIKNELEGFTSISLFGIILGFTILFVPLGTEILSSVKFSELDVTTNLSLLGITVALIIGLIKSNKWIDIIASFFISAILYILPYEYIFTLEINWQFIFGSFFTLLPVIAIITKKLWLKMFSFKYVNLIKEFKLISNVYKNDSSDQSSIDFEQYFKGILRLFSEKKFIIVIDNLDRIDHEDSKKIWSTLQIFLQHRNPVSNSGTTESYKNLWLIIPYDHDSLIKNWDLKVFNLEPTQEKRENLKIETYLEKCFQIRIDIPNMTMNDWVKMAENLLKEACPKMIKTDIQNIIYEMQIYRSSLTDNPNPRTLKLYINQISFYYSSTHSFYKDKEFPFKSLSFFIIKKYLDNSKNEKILKSLISSEYEGDKVKYKLEDQFVDNIACFSYFMEPEKALELFIEKNINESLFESNHEKLQNIETKFPSTFWFLFDRLDKKDVEFLKNLPTLYKALWDKPKFLNSKNEIKKLIAKIKDNEINFLVKLLNNENKKYYSAFDCMIDIYKKENRLDDLSKLLTTIGGQNKNVENIVSLFDSIKKEIKYIKDFYFYFIEQIKKTDFKNNKPNIELTNFDFTIQFLRYWKKKDEIFFHISESIHFYLNDDAKNSSHLQPVFIYKNYIDYCIKTGYKLSDHFINNIFLNLENSLSNESQQENADCIDVLISLFNSQKYNQILEQNFKVPELALILPSLNINKKTFINICFLTGMLSSEKENFLDETEISYFWTHRNKENSDFIVELINDFEYTW